MLDYPNVDVLYLVPFKPLVKDFLPDIQGIMQFLKISADKESIKVKIKNLELKPAIRKI